MVNRRIEESNKSIVMEPVSVESSPRQYSPQSQSYFQEAPGAPKASRKPPTCENESMSSMSPCPPRNLNLSFTQAEFDFEFDELEPHTRSVPLPLPLTFSSLLPLSISPVSLGSVSASVSASASASTSSSESLLLPVTTATTSCEIVGECNVCYDKLFQRANHVFTQCGHLFCVKCFIRWTDTSSTCPMCRRVIIEPDNHGDDTAGYHDENWIHTPPPPRADYNGESENDSDNDNDNANANDDDNDDEGGYDYSYLHNAQDAELVADTSFDMQTDPEYGDEQSDLSTMELELIQYNRLVVSCVFLRNRFHETLFSETIWGGMVQYTLIPKVEWLQIWENVPLYTQRAPSQMFEFVIRRNSEIFRHHRPDEVNTFGYIIGATEVASVEFDGRVSFAFDVMVMSPTVPLGNHNIADGIIQTEHLTLTFNDIRRMYYMTSVETRTQIY